MSKKHDRHNHHRKSRSMGGKTGPRNISNVPVNLHRAYHLLFGVGDPMVIVRTLNEIWIDPDYRLIAVKKEEFDEVLRVLQR